MTALRAPSFLLAVLGTFLLVSTAVADDIVLRSGERLTGRIVDKNTEELVLEIASGEPLRIKWDEIFSLQTDAPMDAMLTRNGSAVRIPVAGSHLQDDGTGTLQATEPV
jgi:hypothetical protein